MTVRIALDAFPAVVNLPSGAELRRARVIVTDTCVTVWTVEGNKPKKFFERPLTEWLGGKIGRGITVRTPDGDLTVRRDASDCGCGHPLKSFNPFRGETRQRIKL